MNENNLLLYLKNVTKVFPGVKALKGVQLNVYKGEVHALCGENGAGKSTLMKIISGAQDYTSGEMCFEGKQVRFSSTKEAQNLGISMIYQEFNLIPHLTIAENLFLGRCPVKASGWVDWKKMMNDAKKLLGKIGLSIKPDKLVKDLSVAEAQMVEIAKCLSMNSKLIIMDEPTAALTDEEIKRLFEIIEGLKKEGIAIIYISHRMEEIFHITDRITVFRDGAFIKSMLTKDTDYDELVRLMVGKDLTDLFPERIYKPSDIVALETKNLEYKKALKDINFKLHKGEILGIAGLLGSGNILLSKVLSGYYKDFTGDILIEGEKIKVKKPLDAIRNGISLVPDDRKNEGLVLIRNVKENISLASLNTVVTKHLISEQKEMKKANGQIDKLNIKVSSAGQIVGNLSGGNQQKVVFAKMLETKPKILLLAEPTRGVDIGAKAEIYQIMNELCEQGISIILISSDLPELIGMSDRVLVMREGEMVAEIQKDEMNQEKVLAFAAGGVQ